MSEGPRVRVAPDGRLLAWQWHGEESGWWMVDWRWPTEGPYRVSDERVADWAEQVPPAAAEETLGGAEDLG